MDIIMKLSSKHYLNRIWRGMKTRCRNPNTGKSHIYYGIDIHPQWLEKNPPGVAHSVLTPGFISFSTYILEELGDRPTPTHTLDRMNGKLGYVPGNLRWATPSQQNRNRREYTQKNRSSWLRKDDVRCEDQEENSDGDDSISSD